MTEQCCLNWGNRCISVRLLPSTFCSRGFIHHTSFKCDLQSTLAYARMSFVSIGAEGTPHRKQRTCGTGERRIHGEPCSA